MFDNILGLDDMDNAGAVVHLGRLLIQFPFGQSWPVKIVKESQVGQGWLDTWLEVLVSEARQKEILVSEARWKT